MSKFKVTLRRNGSAVGEMHYGSEAVAVTKAKAMKDATGCDVTVAPAKANRRRAATRRRNGTGLSRVSMHSRARAGSPAKMSERLKALGLAFEDFGKAGSPLYSLWNSYRSAQHFAEQTSRGSSASSLAEARVAFQQFVEAERVLLDAVGATRRRNGMGLRRSPVGSAAQLKRLSDLRFALEHAMQEVKAAEAMGGGTDEGLARLNRLLSSWTKARGDSFDPTYQQAWEVKRQLDGHRRNPESTTLWTVRVGSQEIGEFHAPSQLTAAIARKAAKVAAEQGYTASMFKRWGSVSDGMHGHSVAPFLKNGHRCNPACGCPKSNRRRNGAVTSARIPGSSARIQKANDALRFSAAEWKKMKPNAAIDLFFVVEAALQDAYAAAGSYMGQAEISDIGAQIDRDLRPIVDAHWANRNKNPRRRNGTTAGEAAASRSLAHRAAMLLTR